MGREGSRSSARLTIAGRSGPLRRGACPPGVALSMGQVRQPNRGLSIALVLAALLLAAAGPAFGLPPVRKTPGGPFVTDLGAGVFSVPRGQEIEWTILMVDDCERHHSIGGEDRQSLPGRPVEAAQNPQEGVSDLVCG